MTSSPVAVPNDWPYRNADSHIQIGEYSPALRCTECRQWCHPDPHLGWGLCACCAEWP